MLQNRIAHVSGFQDPTRLGAKLSYPTRPGQPTNVQLWYKMFIVIHWIHSLIHFIHLHYTLYGIIIQYIIHFRYTIHTFTEYNSLIHSCIDFTWITNFARCDEAITWWVTGRRGDILLSLLTMIVFEVGSKSLMTIFYAPPPNSQNNQYMTFRPNSSAHT